MKEVRAIKRSQTLAHEAVVPWLARPAWTMDELTRLLLGLTLPAVGHESPPWYWILDALRSAEAPVAARDELARRVALWLMERPVPWNRSVDPTEAIYNALNIAVSDPHPEVFAPALRALKNVSLKGEHRGVLIRDLLRDAARSNRCLQPSKDELLAMQARLGASVKAAGGEAASWQVLRDQLQALKQLWPFWEQCDLALMQIAEDQSWPKWAWEALPRLYRINGESVQVWVDLGFELKTNQHLKIHVDQRFSHVALIQLRPPHILISLVHAASEMADQGRGDVALLTQDKRKNITRTSVNFVLSQSRVISEHIFEGKNAAKMSSTKRSVEPNPFHFQTAPTGGQILE